MEFRCRVRNYRNYGLEIFIGENTRIFPPNALSESFTDSLHPGEFYANKLQAENCTAMSCEGIGIFWMVANSRTLPLMDYFWCRATHNGQHEDSNQAFIVDVVFPDCSNRTLVTLNKPVTTTKIPKTMPTSHVHSDTSSSGSRSLIFTWFLLFFSSVCVLVHMDVMYMH